MRRNGFTLIEVVTVLAILSVLAAVLIPLTIRDIDKSRITAAQKDTQAIATAIVKFHIDEQPLWPVYSNYAGSPTPNVYILRTLTGDDATANNNGVWLTATTDEFEDQLRDNTPGYPSSKWKGPYMGEFRADPWGRRYYAAVGSIFDNGAWAAGANPAEAWVISPGPNGNIDTDPKGTLNSDPPGGTTADDIGFLITSYSP